MMTNPNPRYDRVSVVDFLERECAKLRKAYWFDPELVFRCTRWWAQPLYKVFPHNAGEQR